MYYVSLMCLGGLSQLMGVMHKRMCTRTTVQQEDSGM